MRLTYTYLETQFLKGTQNAGSTSTSLINFFQLKQGDRYQTIFAELQSYVTQQPKTAVTTASRQFEHMPPGVVSVQSATVDIGARTIPLTVCHSQDEWDRINEYMQSSGSFPQIVFPRRDDFGTWPIPQGAYTITFNANIRDKTLTVADYTTGTVSVANNSTEIVGAGGAIFTAGMVGRWFKIGSAASIGQGYWYRLSAFTDAQHMNMETSYTGSDGSGLTYVIGETPELPEELHQLLYLGPIADYFAEIRGDLKKATWFNNLFWTGDGQNNSRQLVDAVGGLLGAKKRYSTRSNSGIIKRLPKNTRYSLADKLAATTIS